MRLTLEPIDNPDLEPIAIEEALFDIGRAAPPFNNYAAETIGQLSRRHARLFGDQGACFIMDLGSQNGTLLNGTPVGKTPAPISHGDEIQAGGLRYRVLDHSEREPTAQQEASRQIQLVPDSSDSAALLFVNEFPCLVSKSEGLIARYCAIRSIDPQYLSRRHALFFAIGDDLFLEDLGSTNGTEVNGKRLADEPAKLANGDKIRFGDVGDLTFQVNILVSEEDLEATVVAAQAGAEADNADDSPRTVLMDNPDSFLDIFVNEPNKEQPAEDQAASSTPASTGIFTLLRKEWRTLMGHTVPVPGLRQPIPLLRYLLNLALVAIVSVTLWVNLRVDYQEQARELYDAGNYPEAARIATTGLQATPENSSLQELSTSSTLRWILPAWQDAMDRNDYAAAAQTVGQAAFVESGNNEAGALLQLLAWASRLQQTSDDLQSGTAEAISANKTEIKQLLQFWQTRPRLNQHYLGLITQHHPQFAPAEAHILSQLRDLNNIKSVYLEAIEKLNSALARALARDDIQGARQTLADFDRKYPAVEGTGDLRHDLDQYVSMLQLLEQQKMMDLVRAREETSFATAIFETNAERRFGQLVPQADELAKIRAARQAWREGELQGALDTLNNLLAEQDSQPATELKSRYEQLLAEHLALQKNSADPADAQRMLAFVATLDPEDDKHLYDTLQANSNSAGQQLQGDVRALALSAEGAWSNYHTQGGITASLRLEMQISPEFKQRAGDLLLAHEQIESAATKSALLKTEFGEANSLLRSEVAEEIKLQRSSITDLKILLGEELTDQKLAYLFAEK